MSNHDPLKSTPVKRFGYLLSAIFLVLTNIALIYEWPSIPYLTLVTMYFLTASLWFPKLINPLYKLFGKYIIKEIKSDEKHINPDHFSEN
jgi:hypothetical protein